MSYVLVRHKVDSFTKWKPEFDALKDRRRAGGEKTYHIFHNADDANNLVLLFEWDNLENARRFMQSDELRHAMQRAEVTDQPDIYFLNEGERGSVQ